MSQKVDEKSLKIVDNAQRYDIIYTDIIAKYSAEGPLCAPWLDFLLG
jgi:hypothetical protein